MSDRNRTPSSLNDFCRWLESAPAGTTLDASAVHAVLSTFATEAARPDPADAAVGAPVVNSWREKLWMVSADVRLGVMEAAEAIGRPRSWVYKHTSTKAPAGERLPHRKLDGELQFLAGELRTWIREHEEIVEAGRSTATLSLAGRQLIRKEHH